MPSTRSYTLSLPDALPIYLEGARQRVKSTELDIIQNVEQAEIAVEEAQERIQAAQALVASAQENFRLAQGRFDAGVGTILELTDRKSTRLNSSHRTISYAVHSQLHPFPTRRSSDLPRGREAAGEVYGARHHPERRAGRDRGRGGAGAYPGRPGPRRFRPGELPARAGSVRRRGGDDPRAHRSEEHTSELQSPYDLVCRPLAATPFPYPTLFRSTSRARGSG